MRRGMHILKISCVKRIMAKTEEFRPVAAAGNEDITRRALLEDTYKPQAMRVADQGAQQRPEIFYKPGALINDSWPVSKPGAYPGNNPIHWNGNKPDVSRGPGGTVFQPRPGFDTRDQVGPKYQAEPGVAPLAVGTTDQQQFPPNSGVRIGASRDGTGKWQGPVILPDPHNQWQLPPADGGTAGGLIDRNGDGKLEDERSTREKGMTEFRLCGSIAGFLAGMVKGGLRGAAVGVLLGLVATEVLKPLNPFD